MATTIAPVRFDYAKNCEAKKMSKLWVGADPGGKGSFGLALLDASGELECYTVSSVAEAVERIVSTGEPLGLGIDAPMWWSASESGWRMADCRLRERYPAVSGSVLSVNSLRGAALAGGMMLASRVREMFPAVAITESHPKVLLGALELDEAGFARRFGICPDWNNEHERDATIAAVCAREGFARRWTADLALQRHRAEQDPQAYWLAPMHYFWPEAL